MFLEFSSRPSYAAYGDIRDETAPVASYRRRTSESPFAEKQSEGLTENSRSLEITRNDTSARGEAIRSALDLYEQQLNYEKAQKAKQKGPVRSRKWKVKPFGEMRSILTFDTVKEDAVENTLSSFSYIRAGIKGTISSTFNYKLTGNFEYAMEKNGKLSDWVDVDLHEAYLGWHKGDYDISFGKQVYTWGKLDDYAILDVLNSQDHRHFFLLDKEERKIPVSSFKVSRLFDLYEGGLLELVVVPKFKPNKVNFFGDDFAVFGHIKETINSGNYSAATKGMISGIDINEDDGERSLEYMDVALRSGVSFQNVDVNFSYLYKRDPSAVIKTNNANERKVKAFLFQPTSENLLALGAASPGQSDLILSAEHPRLNIFGFDLEGVLWGFGWRYEWAYVRNKYMTRDDFSEVKKSYMAQGFGIDNQRTDFYVNLQLISNHIFDYDPLYMVEQDSTLVSATTSWTSSYGRFEAGLESVYDMMFGDYRLNPYVRLSDSKGLSLTVGSFVFEGDPATPFGKYNNSDVAYMDLKYEF